MPKGPQGQKRPTDVIGNAVRKFKLMHYPAGRGVDRLARTSLRGARRVLQVRSGIGLRSRSEGSSLISALET